MVPEKAVKAAQSGMDLSPSAEDQARFNRHMISNIFMVHARGARVIEVIMHRGTGRKTGPEPMPVAVLILNRVSVIPSPNISRGHTPLAHAYFMSPRPHAAAEQFLKKVSGAYRSDEPPTSHAISVWYGILSAPATTCFLLPLYAVHGTQHQAAGAGAPAMPSYSCPFMWEGGVAPQVSEEVAKGAADARIVELA
ncbi:hypothetical protein H9P43_006940 [Blastocladiella emersonii ATCC 22665]|nr:hypothetical protein H9P43_006940 [Blastocladiella emersonii ATCC 22665]